MVEHPTPYYKTLVKDLEHLNALVKGVNVTQPKTVLQDLKVQSYILLSHAIFEEYIEQLTLNIALESRKIVVEQGKITKALMGLVSCGIVMEATSKKSNRKIAEIVFRNIADFSIEAFSKFQKLVGQNNGIKVDNQKDLFLPIGIDPAQTDSATMASLDAFGTKRGGIAHKFKIEKLHALGDINREIVQIRDGLLIFDQAACDALRLEMTIEPPL